MNLARPLHVLPDVESRLLPLALVAGLLVGGAIVGDALFVTDEERLEVFVDALSGELDDDAIGEALSFADPNREPVELLATGGVRARFDEGQEARLAHAARELLAPFASTDLDLVQRTVDVHGDDARVAVRVRAEGALHDATFDFARHGDGWLLRRARVRSGS
ncbi:MAG: hypothetical protein AAGH15_27080 [Myxococcota bacterium]